jgi:uncharacterized membrane-anchored protein
MGGLSVAAIIFCIVGLVVFAAKGFPPLAPKISAETVEALSFPAALAVVAVGLYRF